MPPGGRFFILQFRKFSSWTDFHFKILKVDLFQIEGGVFSLHLAIYTIQTAFLHIEMGVFYQKNTFLGVFEPYLKKPQLPPPPPNYINCPPPLSLHQLGLLFCRAAFLHKKAAPVDVFLGGGVEGAVAFLSPSPTP